MFDVLKRPKKKNKKKRNFTSEYFRYGNILFEFEERYNLIN